MIEAMELARLCSATSVTNHSIAHGKLTPQSVAMAFDSNFIPYCFTHKHSITNTKDSSHFKHSTSLLTLPKEWAYNC
eukprot:859562-Pelagomonas_calceolata.AAC.2